MWLFASFVQHINMKFSSIFLLLFALFFRAEAQITIQGADLPKANDTIRITSTNASSIDINATGANYTWNFSSLPSSGETLKEYKNALQTPYGLFFIGFNFFGTKGNDITFGGFGLKDLYDYYLIDNAQYAIRGLGFTFQEAKLGASYSVNQRILKLPARYLDSDSSNFSIAITIPNIGQYKSSGTRAYEVDGWGNITTPYGSFDCIRVKSHIKGVDSLKVSISGFNFSFGIPNERYEYSWYAKGQKLPVLQIEGRFVSGNFLATSAYYRGYNKNTSTSISTEQQLEWNIFPNPASKNCRITFDNQAIGGVLTVFDVSGRPVFTQLIQQQQIDLDLSTFSSGMFSAVVQKNGNLFSKQLVLTK